eukprot:1147450-Pelagomonas_calceolata.AAC.2
MLHHEFTEAFKSVNGSSLKCRRWLSSGVFGCHGTQSACLNDQDLNLGTAPAGITFYRSSLHKVCTIKTKGLCL